MSKEKKYGLIFTLIIFVGIGLSINGFKVNIYNNR